MRIGNYTVNDGKLYYGTEYILNIDIDGFMVTDIFLDENDLFCITLTGYDKQGAPVMITSEYNPSGNSYYDTSFDYSTDIIRQISVSTNYYLDNKYIFTVDAPIPQDRITQIGEYRMVSATNLIIKDHKAVFEYDPDAWIRIVDDFIAVGYGPSDWLTYYNADMKPLYETSLYNFTKLSDGRYIAKSSIIDSGSPNEILPKAVIFDKDGNILWKSSNDRNCLIAGDSFMLFRKADGIRRLYTPDNELLCEFPEWKDSYSFHYMLSGVYEKDGRRGYYFITEDPDDTKPYTEGAEYGTYGNRIWEYYYIPETGESGVIDNGYGEFAYAKPVLYLYPEAETDVTVTFDHPERLTTVYPAYNGGWSVTAKPDGTLTDARGRTYYCLYWEEKPETPVYRFKDGFCVKGEDSAAFLEDALAKLGFTEREANEFIIYWLPIMERNEYNLIRFELTEEREAASGLNIFPAPDSILRMAMHIKAVDAPTDIPEQTLPTFERNGFVAVEWGGCVH